MATHTSSITPVDTSLGTAPSSDGVMGLLSKALAVSGTFVLDTPYLITSLADLEALGITSEYDAANNLAFHQQVSEFYDEVGTTSGALLWVQGTAKTNSFASYVDTTPFTDFLTFSAQADPANAIKIIGLCYDVPTTLQSAGDFPADVLATVSALQTVQENLFPQGTMFAAIVDGQNMSSTVTPASIGTQANAQNYAVALCISSTLGNGVSQVGMALGRCAKITIGTNMSKAKLGAVSQSTAYLTNSIRVPTTGTLIVGHTYTAAGGTVLYNSVTYQAGQSFVAVTGFTSYTTADTGQVIDNATPMQSLGCLNTQGSAITQFAAKQYLFVGQLFQKQGFYWNDGSTCTSNTNAFSDLAYMRVLIHLCAGVLNFIGDQYGDTPPVVTSTGALDPSVILGWEQTFYDLWIGPLTTNGGTGDITDGSITFSAPNYSTNQNITYKLQIIRNGVVGNWTGTFQYVATL